MHLVSSSLLQVVARDDDYGMNGQTSYSLSVGNDGGSFSLTSNGQLRLEKTLDREVRDRYELIVIAIDSGKTTRLHRYVVSPGWCVTAPDRLCELTYCTGSLRSCHAKS